MTARPLHLDESTSAAPDFSPGVVQDDERLLRALFNPEHVQEGQVLPRAISLRDLRARGFSVHRIRYVSADFVLSFIDQVVARPRRGERWRDAGAATFYAARVRSILLEGQRAFVVIDTASPENPGHAAIYAAEPERGDAHARELRALLLPLLHDRISVREAFNQ